MVRRLQLLPLRTYSICRTHQALHVTECNAMPERTSLQCVTAMSVTLNVPLIFHFWSGPRAKPKNRPNLPGAATGGSVRGKVRLKRPGPKAGEKKIAFVGRKLKNHPIQASPNRLAPEHGMTRGTRLTPHLAAGVPPSVCSVGVASAILKWRKRCAIGLPEAFEDYRTSRIRDDHPSR